MMKTFEQLINLGMEQLEYIGEPEKKATICAELAKAIAQSGVLAGGNPTISTKVEYNLEVAEEEETQAEEVPKAKKAKSKKSAIKKGANKTEEIVEEETFAPEEAPEEAVEEEKDEWTEENTEAHAESLGQLEAYCEAWGEEYVYGDCLYAFSEGLITGVESVTPSMIEGFVAYLVALAQTFADEQ